MTTLKTAQDKIDASVEAFRKLLEDDPQDYFEAANRLADASDLVDEAQTLGNALKGKDRDTFLESFGQANTTIERYEAQRLSGTDGDEEEPEGVDNEEPEDLPEDEEETDVASPGMMWTKNEKAGLYSSMAEPEESE